MGYTRKIKRTSVTFTCTTQMASKRSRASRSRSEHISDVHLRTELGSCHHKCPQPVRKKPHRGLPSQKKKGHESTECKQQNQHKWSELWKLASYMYLLSKHVSICCSACSDQDIMVKNPKVAVSRAWQTMPKLLCSNSCILTPMFYHHYWITWHADLRLCRYYY